MSLFHQNLRTKMSVDGKQPTSFPESNTSSSILRDCVPYVEVDHVGLVSSLYTDGKRLKGVKNKGHKTLGGRRLEAMMAGENLEAKQT